MSQSLWNPAFYTSLEERARALNVHAKRELDEARRAHRRRNDYKAKAKAEQTRMPELTHLTGVRFLANFWIVCGHFIPRHPETVLNHVNDRGNVAVNFFITMSGFITHWAYSGKRMEDGAVGQYYARRLGRVFVATWFAMGAAALIMLASGEGEQLKDAGHLTRCFLFMEPWLEPNHWCPNGQTWTIAALLPSWLLYPWTRNLIVSAEALGDRLASASSGASSSLSGASSGPSSGPSSGAVRNRWGGGWALVLLMAWCWLLEFGAMLAVYFAQGRTLSLQQHYWSYAWPPAQVLDFFIGCAAAHLAKRHAAAGPESWPCHTRHNPE